MRGLSLERPPRWGLISLALLVAANVALFVLLGGRNDREVAGADTGTRAAASTAAVASAPPPATTGSPSTPSASGTPPVLAVYGDGYAAGNEQGGVGPAGWPALVADQSGASLSLHAVAQAGYASLGVTGEDYLDLVAANPVPDAAVTLLFGSRNDRGEDLGTVRTNATQAISAVRANAPGSAVVVIGPAWDDGDVPGDLVEVRNAVQAAAQEAGATFVDPLAAGWFADQSGLISGDGISPNDDGHVYLSQQVLPIVESALAEVAAQP
ncbi:MAG: conserved hypothetical secreted protein [Modestobacter sp.]|jgi:hypothetical protein|nr:conserved hypothetical secreted protein [Modestobacter sp.]